MDAFDCVNQTFKRPNRSDVEAALLFGYAKFIVVGDPGRMPKVEPLVFWITCLSDVIRLESYLADTFDLYAVMALDSELGCPSVRYSESNFVVGARTPTWVRTHRGSRKVKYIFRN